MSFSRTGNLYNGTLASLSNKVVPFSFTDANWDFASYQTNGADVRISDSNGANVPYWLAKYDATSRSGVGFCRPTSFPPGDNTITFALPNSNAAAASSFSATMSPYVSPNTADLYAQFPLTETSGTARASTVGGWVGVWNGGTNSESTMPVGDKLVYPTATHNFLRMDGVSNVLAIPDLMSTFAPPSGTIMFWMRQQKINGSGSFIFSMQRFGLGFAYLVFSGNNRMAYTHTYADGVGQSTTLPDITFINGASGQVDTTWRHFAISYGQRRGVSLLIDGQMIYNDPTITSPSRTRTQDTSSGSPATTMSFGAYYDPRPGNSSGFSQIDVSGIQIFATELDIPQIHQVRYRMETHPIETAYTRLKDEGLLIPPSADPVIGQSVQEPNAIDTTAIDGTLSVFARCGYSISSNSTSIYRFGITSNRAIVSTTHIVGGGAGGLSTTAVCPSYAVDANTGESLIYHAGSGFSGLYYAKASNATATSWTSQGSVDLGGFTNTSSIGNTHIWQSGTNWLGLVENASAGHSFHVAILSGTSRSKFTATDLPDAAFSLADDTSGGPQRIDNGDGTATILLHSNLPSCCYMRTVANDYLAGPVWSPYSIVRHMRQHELQASTNGDISQNADPHMVYLTWPNGASETLLTYDILTTDAYAGIGLSSFKGSPADLMTPSVRLDLPGIAVPTVSWDSMAFVVSLGGTISMPFTSRIASGSIAVPADLTGGPIVTNFRNGTQTTGINPATSHVGTGSYNATLIASPTNGFASGDSGYFSCLGTNSAGTFVRNKPYTIVGGVGGGGVKNITVDVCTIVGSDT